MTRTKIVATIGPASAKPEVFRLMLRAGLNVARVNFSHGSHESHQETIEMIRRIAREEGKVLAILGDLQGPKIRFGLLPDGGIELKSGDRLRMAPEATEPDIIPLPHPEIFPAIRPGSRMVIGDGELEFRVLAHRDNILTTEAIYPGLLESRKGINMPGTMLPISSITEKDKEDLLFACRMDLDYIALSFVRTADDIRELREIMATCAANIPIIAKIEKSEALEHLEEILHESDGMMVARGDLGIDVPPQQVPFLQKQIIRACNEVGKPVITATQMLQSMVSNPRPTRAEASDVANAILDGSDAIMLSGETASGKYPVESVLMMRHISEITEQEFPYDVWQQRRRQSIHDTTNITAAISAACCGIAEEVDASLIVSTTMSGYTARQIARHRPRTPIVAVSPLEQTQRRLALVWGVECFIIPYFRKTDTMFKKTRQALRPLNLHKGERMVFSAGVPFGETGQTNLITVQEIGAPGFD
ncbi:MAG: pyruvate kinase [Anaerolineales bacterium]|nr:pyruvate kinase [Anaerolineales bacterium]MCB0010792.1 pyruvate kinase [Anaerolineales bacterium]MCB0016725.1 pyruvate kinase [Anaerolineales bacterium]MCB0027115.1 pyruvate kinase [Anaerolineales bacterium]MCB8961823.1 pyruvate kinase [Ardenticatenales bacterium]